MAKNKLQDLRDHLFAAIEQLEDPDSQMSIEKAKAIAAISQTIINSAKLEIEAKKVFDKLTGFYPDDSFIDTPVKKYLP
jgi:hypothetical protein